MNEFQSAYRRRLSIEGVILFLLALILASSHAHADGFHVQHNGQDAFCTQGLQVTGSTYNFVTDCATPPPPANQLTRANVLYVGHDAAQVPNVDLTQWAPVWGRITASAPPLLWPNMRGATPQWVMPTNGYTCTLFRTTSTTGANVLSMSSYNTAGNLGASISTTCGDFSMPVGGCHKEGVGAFAASFFTYIIGVDSTAYRCGLLPNSPYYLNLHWTNSAPTEPGGNVRMCTAAGCKVAVTSNTSPT